MKRLIMLVAALFVAASFAPRTAEAQAKPVTTAFFEGGPKTLDPHAATTLDEFQVLYNVYEGLLTYDPNTLEPRALLAETYDISADSKVYTFKLHKGVKFQNGREMTADDVKYSFERLGNPKTGTSYTSLVLNNVVGFAAMRAKENPVTTLAGVVAKDKYTVEITLTAPTASFLNQLTLPGAFIVPKEAADAAGFADKPVGTGPYTVSKYTRGQQVVLAANASYWNGAPTIKQATIRVIPEASQQIIEYRGGNIDIAVVPESQIATLKADATLGKQLFVVPILSVFHLRVNLKDKDLSKPEVRQALAIAIDRQALVDTILGGNGSPAHGIIPPGLSAYDKSYNPFPRDIAKAKTLLAAAGYPDGITLEVRTGQIETENRILQAIQQQVAEAGITLKINSTEKSLYDTDRGACKMQLGTIAWSQDYADPDDFAMLLTGASGSRGNCGYNDYPQAAAVNALLAKGSTMQLGSARDDVYRQAERLAIDVAAIIPIYHGTRSVLINPRLQGPAVVDANSFVLFANVFATK